MEIWKELEGFRIKYLISVFGEIKSPDQTVDIGLSRSQFKKERIIKSHISNTGYVTVGLTFGRAKSRGFHVHRLLAQTFLPNPNGYRCINHKDGNKLNNSLNNLEWVTHAQNNKHAYDIGLKKPFRKVTTDQVKQMRALSKCLYIPNMLLASMYGISRSAVSKIVNFKTRNHG